LGRTAIGSPAPVDSPPPFLPFCEYHAPHPGGLFEQPLHPTGLPKFQRDCRQVSCLDSHVFLPRSLVIEHTGSCKTRTRIPRACRFIMDLLLRLKREGGFLRTGPIFPSLPLFPFLIEQVGGAFFSFYTRTPSRKPPPRAPPPAILGDNPGGGRFPSTLIFPLFLSRDFSAI